MSDETKERQLIEGYMKEYALEAVIDEVVNGVLETRPKNPYIEMSRLMEAKSMAEIISVSLSPLTTSTGGAIRATVSTNVGAFSATCGTSPTSSELEGELRDYTVVQNEIESYLLGKNPTELQKIDEILQRIENLDPSVSIALSMACARAGARHKAMELYRFLAECARTTPAMPMPSVAVVSRAAGPEAEWSRLYQDVSIIPTTSSNFGAALEAILKAYRRVVNLVVDRKFSLVPASEGGCPRVRAPLSDILKVAHDAISMEGSIGGLKLLLDLKGCDIAAVTESETAAPAVTYRVGGAPPAAPEKPTDKKAAPKGKADVAPTSPRAESLVQSGPEFVDSFISSWIDYEMISVEDPATDSDLDTLRLLKTKVVATVDAIRTSGGSKFSYAFSGVGEDSRCPLQIVADAVLTKPENIRKFSDEAVFNSVKVRPLRCRTVSECINLVHSARQVGWAVIIGHEENAPETTDSFISDFAVAVGAGQFSCGGFGNGNFSAKFDRLLQISETDDSILFVGKRFRC